LRSFIWLNSAMTSDMLSQKDVNVMPIKGFFAAIASPMIEHTAFDVVFSNIVSL